MMARSIALTLILGCVGASSFAGCLSAQTPGSAPGDPRATGLSPQDVANAWFECLEQNRFKDAQKLLNKDILWENIPPVPGVTDAIPWLGTFHGLDDALRGIGIWARYARLRSYQLRRLLVAGDTAIGLVHERGECIANRKAYDVDVAVILTVTDGQITRYQTIWDPSPLVRSFAVSR